MKRMMLRKNPKNQAQNPNLEFLKSNTGANLSRDVIASKLNSTRDFRNEMMKSAKTDLRCHFPFMLNQPKIVSKIEISFLIQWLFLISFWFIFTDLVGI